MTCTFPARVPEIRLRKENQARIIRQEEAITDVEGDTIDAAKEKLRVWVENDEQSKGIRLALS
jgi:hypothetical protein